MNRISECPSCGRKSEIFDLAKACPFCVPKVVLMNVPKADNPLNALLTKKTPEEVMADEAYKNGVNEGKREVWKYLNDLVGRERPLGKWLYEAENCKIFLDRNLQDELFKRSVTEFLKSLGSSVVGFK